MSKEKSEENKTEGNPFSEQNYNNETESEEKVSTEKEKADDKTANENIAPEEGAVPDEAESEEEKPTETGKKGILEGLFGKGENSEEVKKLKASYDELNNKYLRLAADFDNYRKRQATERESLIKFGTEEALKKLIEIADNFERAEKVMDTIDSTDKAKESFAVINKQFKDALIKLGLEEIKAEGEKFDPMLHEAVMQTQSDEHPEETVLRELQKGYKYADKVLRPSMVSVSVK